MATDAPSDDAQIDDPADSPRDPLIGSLTHAPLFLIAGPCVIESRDLCLTIGHTLAEHCRRLGIPFIFKASFDKANRSSGRTFRGLGIEEGLGILADVRRELGVPVLTDVHESTQVPAVGKVVDVLQVPAFLARQTDLLVACGRSGKAVNIKKGQFMAPAEMAHAAAKVREGGSDGGIASQTDLLLTERGTFFGYGRLVNDFTALPMLRSISPLTVFDATHSTQRPAGQGDRSGGDPSATALLARAAVAAGYRGLFLECHPTPREALSDAATMLDLHSVPALLGVCRRLAEAVASDVRREADGRSGSAPGAAT